MSLFGKSAVEKRTAALTDEVSSGRDGGRMERRGAVGGEEGAAREWLNE